MPRHERREWTFKIHLKLDTHFNAGEFSEVDTLLANLDPQELDELGIITYLCASLAAKDKLKERESFFQRSRVALQAKLPPEELEEVLGGLE